MQRRDRAGEHEHADPLLREEVAATASALGSQHPETRAAARRLAHGLEARGLLDEALRVTCEHFGLCHRTTVELTARVARANAARGRGGEASRAAEEAAAA